MVALAGPAGAVLVGGVEDSAYPPYDPPLKSGFQPYEPPPRPTATRPVRLDARTLAQLALEQNAEVLYARLQSRVSEQAAEAETGLYLPVAYANLRREGRNRQRTVEERLQAALGGITRLDEQVLGGEAGLRMKAPTGAEVALAWRSTQRRSNVIGSASFATGDSESTGALVLSLRQPLLRGAGRDVIETDLRVARYESQIGAWQFRQQVLRIGSDALSSYWQLWRARETQALRTAALDNARETVEDVRLRVDGGRLAPGSLDEAQAVLAARRAELARGQQALLDAEAKVRVMLDLPPQDGDWQLAAPELDAPPAPSELAALAERLPDIEAAWPPLRMALLKREQADARLRLAYSKKLPALDVQASYSTNSLVYGPLDAAVKAAQGRNPDWTIGVAVEVPIGGDRRAQAEYRAQQLRVEQSALEVHSVRQALASDYFNRAAQAAELGRELVQLREELVAREQLEAGVREQFNSGAAPRGRLLRLQADVLDARMRLIDGTSRWALARVALQLVDGSLLTANDVQITE
ncbi:TolC family protein [Roseateles cellulosilyticus]|uniref:TolC family protein n=1 Tax=Pelomonas cellulosilytica TaxID=2906762 RepID=A0ABS8XJM8_9BURK|nr:TolC family protein [Pelomonas sp. P8]